MKCPYNKQKYQSVQKFEQTANENGVITKGVTGNEITFVLMDCLQGNCGAWQDGKCNYKGVK